MKKKLLLLALSLTLISCQPIGNESMTNINENLVEEVEVQEENIDTSITTEEESVLYLVPVVLGEQWGYAQYDDLEKIVIDYSFDQAGYFNDLHNFAIVYKNDQAAIIDKEGQFEIEFGMYKNLHVVDDDLLYGTKTTGEPVILDYKGTELLTLQSTDTLNNRNGVLEININGQISYFDPVTQQVIPLDENMHPALKDVFFDAVDQAVDVSYDEINGKYHILRGGKILSETGYDFVRLEEDFITVGLKKETSDENIRESYRYGVLDEKGHVIVDPLYDAMIHLSGDYFAVAQNDSIVDFDPMYFQHNYKKAIFHRTKAVTGFDYYILEYVKDDVFYVFDGESYYFMDVSTGEEMMIPDVSGPLTFRIVGDLIIAEYDGYDGHVIYYIQDWVIKKRYTQMIHLENGRILKKFTAAGIHPIFYPVVALDNAGVENNINTDLKKHFDASWSTPEEEDIYFNDASQGFYVESYQGLLQIVSTNYWYYIGAAHGNYGEIVFLYDMATGDRVDEQRLFKEDVDFHKELAMALGNLAKDDERLYTDVSALTEEELLEFFKRESYNMIFTKTGLKIFYNPYDIGPYAAGIIDFIIPYDMLSDILKEDLPWLKDES